MFINRGLTLSTGLMGIPSPGLEMAFHANSTPSTGVTITIPATVLPGDYMLFFDYGRDGSNPPTKVNPSGWDELFDASSSNTNQRITVSSRIAIGGDEGATVTGQASSIRSIKQLLVFRPTKAIENVIPQGTFGSTTSNPAALVATCAGFAPPVIVIGYYASQVAFGDLTPLTFSGDTEDGERRSSSSSAGDTAAVRFKVYGSPNSVPVDITIDMTDLGPNAYGMSYIQFE